MFMYRAAVHSLDAEFTILEMTTSNAFFSRELKILYHFIHASILEINSWSFYHFCLPNRRLSLKLNGFGEKTTAKSICCGY